MITEKRDTLQTWITAFLRDVKSRGLSDFTYRYYQRELVFFTEFIAGRVTDPEQIDAALLRDYMDWLETERKRNPGGRAAGYRSLRAFLFWWSSETEPDDWKNPFRKVKSPKIAQPPIVGASTDDIKSLLATCGDDFTGHRDTAIILFLLDTGARMREFLALTFDDIDLVSGEVQIIKGKGNKRRTVFIGKKTRKAVRAYLKVRKDDSRYLWVTEQGDHLAVQSLQFIFTRRGKAAGLEHPPSPHDFRRAFALNMLRAGVDIYSLRDLMGHSDLSTLLRYLALVTDDARAAHDKGSPVDKLII
jgi:site-specific recombinase XerD